MAEEKTIPMVQVQAISPGVDHTGLLRGPGMVSKAGENLSVFEMPEDKIVNTKGKVASWLKVLGKLSGIRPAPKPQHYNGVGTTIEALQQTVLMQQQQIAQMMAKLNAPVEEKPEPEKVKAK